MINETFEAESEVNNISPDLAKLSIVVPIYGLKENQESIFKWLGDPLIKTCEKILVHDSSDAESSVVFRERIKFYEKVEFLEEPCNSPGESRNLGLSHATGHWVVFWDADDEPNVEEFSKFFVEFVHSNKEVGVGSYEVIDGDKEIVTTRLLCEHLINNKNLELMRNPGIWSWIFQRSRIGRIRFPKSKRSEDQIFLADLDVFNEDLFKSERIIYRYKLGLANQLTSNHRYHNELLEGTQSLFRLAKHRKSQTKSYALTAVIYSYLAWMRNDFYLNGIAGNVYKKLQTTMCFLTVCSLNLKVALQALRQRLRKKNHAKDLSIFLAGGIGNQLFQLSYALSIPTVKHVELINANEHLLVLINKGGLLQELKINKRYVKITTRECYLFEKKLNHFFLREVSRDGNYRKTFVYRIFKLLLRTYYSFRFQRSIKLVNPINIGFDHEALVTCDFSSLHAIGYFQSSVWADSITEILAVAIDNCASASLLDEKQIDSNQNKKCKLAIQIRLTDYLQKKNAKIGRIGIRYFSEALNGIQNASENVVHVFSDSPDLATEFLSDIGDYSFEFVPPNLNVFDNLYLMSRMRFLIISNSSFGWWGAFLATQRGEVCVMVPDPWFKDIEDPCLLIPANWHRHDAFFYTD